MIGRWIGALTILALSIPRTLAKEPLFCSGSCQIPMDSHLDQRRAYVIVQPGGTSVSFQTVSPASTPVEVRLAFPLEYTAGDLVGVMPAATYTAALNPYLQTAEFTPGNESYVLTTSLASNVTSSDDGTFSVASDDTMHFQAALAATPVLIIVGKTTKVTALEIVSLPIAMFNTHGDFFTRQGYYWIFVIVGAVLSTLYVAFARVRAWQALLAYSMGAFAVVFFEKLYHAIVASLVAGSAAQIAYMIVCIVFLAEVIPFTVAAVVMKQARRRAVPWGIVGVLFAVGFLFLAGSGWFVGVGLLGVASILRILSRALI